MGGEARGKNNRAAETQGGAGQCVGGRCGRSAADKFGRGEQCVGERSAAEKEPAERAKAPATQ